MKASHLIAPGLGLTVGLVLLFPAKRADAWSTIGGNLGQSQRDFRVYNNFSDGSDNNNQTYHYAFPNYYGAVQAIWKGCIEWSSLPHGDGSGDPIEGTLGSGGANFDPSFQGEANSVGGSNDNIHSEISGGNGGVLAFAETPISNGWRIRYYENINWGDGPLEVGPNQFDLQGVACHEYGHALGLGHSGNGGATMTPSIGPGNESSRSINNDDQAGVQAIYGSASGSKPVITGVTISGNQITVTGTDFSGSGNQIWFTQAGSGGNGEPVKVTGLSSNGTTLTANIPGNAGPGDVLVRKNSTAHSGLSNPWPTTLLEGPDCVDPSIYCSSLPNSTGWPATLSYTGTGSILANDLTITCSGLPNGVAGIFFYGNNATSTPFGEGLLCVQGGIVRLNVQFAQFGGTAEKVVDYDTPPFDSGAGAAVVGETKRFQFWYRDSMGGPAGFNTSDALSVTFCN